jgi:hypothetical protein
MTVERAASFRGVHRHAWRFVGLHDRRFSGRIRFVSP